MAHSTSVTFSDGTNPAVSIQGPTATDCILLPRFVTGRSANGTRYAYTTTTTKRWEWTLQFRGLTTADKNKLENFFSDTVKGPHGTFAYTHTDGSSYAACRFVDTALPLGRIDDNTWDVTVRIESPNQINS